MTTQTEAMKLVLEALHVLLTEPSASTAANKAESLLLQAAPVLRKALAEQPAREWVGLTDEDKCTVELDEAEVDLNWIDGYKSGLKDAEAKLREKNT